MGVMLAALVLAATGAVQADGHTVVPLRGAKVDVELSCPAPLKNAYLAPLPGNKFGVRAPVQPGRLTCQLKPPKGRVASVPLNFVAPKWPLSVGATRPVVLGQDTEAVLEVRGKALRADGSAGPATLMDDTVRAQLPPSKMPQNLVVLVQGEKGGAAYAVVPLLGRATVKVQTAKDAQVEAVVAGHRSTGFTSDDSGQVQLVIPAPPGFVKGDIDVTANGKTTHATIGLPAAKPLYALAVLGPQDNVAPNSRVELLAAGCNPMGLPPKPKELKGKASAGKLLGLSLAQPGLWKLTMQAPASGDTTVELHLGNATRTITFHVGPPKPVVVAEAPKPPEQPKVEAPKPEVKQAAAEPEPKPEPKPEVAQVEEPKPAELPHQPEPKPLPVAQAEKPETETVVKPVHKRSMDDDEGMRLELLVEGGYLTNGGAISGIAPGGQLQVAYRTGDFDFGGGVDALFASSSQSSSVPSSGTAISTATKTSSLQLLVGPWVRYRFTDVFGVDLSAGAGVSRTSQQIEANGSVNSSGSTSPVAFGGLAGLDLNFGLVRAFAGARYVTASASGDLTGNAGGLAGLVGVGVDLGL